MSTQANVDALDPRAQGLLADIIAHHQDDTPRLIYADWLMEHGQEERAEFIRVQCDLACIEKELEQPYPDQDLCTGLTASWCPVCGDCCCRPEVSLDHPSCPLHHWRSRHHDDRSLASILSNLRHREQELIRLMIPTRDRHGRAGRTQARFLWGPERFMGQWEFRRGFVAEVRAPLAVLIEHLPTLVQQHPIERVLATDHKPDETAGVWWYDSIDMGDIELTPANLPNWVFLLMPGAKLNYGLPFASVQQAFGALSDALLAWAQSVEP